MKSFRILPILSTLLILCAPAQAQRSALIRNNAAINQYYLSMADADMRREIDASKANLATNTGWQVLPPQSFRMVVKQVSPEGIVCELASLDTELNTFVHDRFILLTNHPAASTLISGSPLTGVSARRVGRIDIFGETSGIYDCAKPALPRPRELSPSEKLAAQILADRQTAAAAQRKTAAAIATFKFHKERAEAGNAGSMQRLAELYQAGIGCEQDTNAAAAWLRAAATNTPAR